MDSKDEQIKEIFDSLHRLPKVDAPQSLYSKIEVNVLDQSHNHSSYSKYWQYAAAILIAINTLAFWALQPTESEIEISNQYEDYMEQYNWSQSDYYEFITLSE